jgi:hypothetical protein
MPRVAATLLVYKGTQLNCGSHSHPGFNGHRLRTHQNRSPLSYYIWRGMNVLVTSKTMPTSTWWALIRNLSWDILSLVSGPHCPLKPFQPLGTNQTLATRRCFQEYLSPFASQPSRYQAIVSRCSLSSVAPAYVRPSGTLHLSRLGASSMTSVVIALEALVLQTVV